jgi:hypothetical protein
MAGPRERESERARERESEQQRSCAGQRVFEAVPRRSTYIGTARGATFWVCEAVHVKQSCRGGGMGLCEPTLPLQHPASCFPLHNIGAPTHVCAVLQHHRCDHSHSRPTILDRDSGIYPPPLSPLHPCQHRGWAPARCWPAPARGMGSTPYGACISRAFGTCDPWTQRHWRWVVTLPTSSS